MDFCDVCNGPANLMCGNCMDAVYCSEQCQLQDHPEHCKDCMHPSQMSHEDLVEEVRMHLEDNAGEDRHIGAQLIGQAATEQTTEQLRNWLIGAIFDPAKRHFNRTRVQHQRRAVRREKRSSRRRGRKARQGTRQAKALGREKYSLGVTQKRTARAEQRETLAQSRNL